jgi:hypothetical protein
MDDRARFGDFLHAAARQLEGAAGQNGVMTSTELHDTAHALLPAGHCSVALHKCRRLQRP